jgi:hypothetical protein
MRGIRRTQPEIAMDSSKSASTKAVTADKPESTITLAEICKGLKIEPRHARRVLRKEAVSVEGSRWVWKKGSSELAKVTSLLRSIKSK